MSDSIPNMLPFATAGLFALALALFAIALRLFRRSRTDTFWRRRREAGQRGWRVLLSALVMFVVGGFACLFTLALTLFDADDDATAPAVLAEQADEYEEPLSPAALASVDLPDSLGATLNAADTGGPVTATPAGTDASDNPGPMIVIVTSTPAYTPTETPYPTYTPQTVHRTADITPLPNAAIRVTALDDQISDNFTPVSPNTVFDAGAKRIFFFVSFEGMGTGVAWQRHLFRNDAWLDGGSYQWGLDTDGSSYFFFGSDTGFEPGSYELRLFIGADPTPVSVTPFTVRSAAN